MEEQWKDIDGFPGYQASTLGNLRSAWTKSGTIGDWHILKASIDSQGYPMVAIRKDGVKYNRTVRRLVLETFVGTRPAGMEARHLNGNRFDNRLCNLEWATHRVNIDDKFTHGTNQAGVRNAMHKLTDEDVRNIRAEYVPRGEGTLGNRMELSERYHVHGVIIWGVATRRTWKHVE